MKKIIFLILLVITSTNIDAQNIKKAYKLIDERKYNDAMEILQQAERKGKEDIAVDFGYAKIYSEPGFLRKDLNKAYHCLISAESKFTRSPERSMYEKKYGISTSSLRNIKNKISKEAFTTLKKPYELTELNKFLLIYEGNKYYDQVKEIRDSIVYVDTDKKGHFRDYEFYFNNYPDSKYASTAREKHEKLWRKEYEEISYYGDINIFEAFNKKYPKYPFHDIQSKMNTDLANKARKLNIQKGYLPEKEKDYSDYIKSDGKTEMSWLVLQTMIKKELDDRNFSQAISKIKNHLTYFKTDKRPAELIKILKKNDAKVEKKSISSEVNTVNGEYLASFTADGTKMYFCGRNRPDNLRPNMEDVFVSEFINGKWGKPQLVKDINTEKQHEAPMSISGDGNRMLLYSNSEIYYTDRDEKGWEPKRKFPKINDKGAWEADAMMTGDGKAVLFISDRRGNIGHFHRYGEEFHQRKSGNTDIYVSVKTDLGWSDPINLGDVINTPFTERSPYLHSDMKTLYFSSDGHAGLGNLDVFMSKRLSDTSWTQWSKPVNLGKEINTTDEEFDYEISADGKIAYFSSFKNGNDDIFYLELPKEKQPESVSIVSGKIKDRAGNAVFATIKWEDLTSGKLIGYSKSNPEDGSYIIILPDGKNYGFFVEKEKYYPISGNINLIQEKGVRIKNDVLLISEADIFKNNVSVPLKNLFFDSGKFDLKPESYPELKRLAKLLITYENAKVEIGGYTDNKGPEDMNKKLSWNRANAVKRYLIKIGCKADRLIPVGYGPKNPIAPNDTEEGRAKNRRVEFKIKK